MKPTKGKTVLITGSSRGIGRATALKMAGLGCNVVVNYSHDSSKKEAEKTVKEIEKKGVKAIAVKADVAYYADVKRLVSAAVKEFGHIDYLVNNAGVYSKNPGSPSHELAHGEWRWLIAVNLDGVFYVTKEVVKHMLEKKIKGSVCSVSSVAGIHGSGSGPHYAASKGAVIQLTYSWANEYGPKGITFNAVAPGVTDTKLIKKMPRKRFKEFVKASPLGRAGKPEDVADAIAFLLTQGYVNGQTLVVDGGRVKH